MVYLGWIAKNFNTAYFAMLSAPKVKRNFRAIFIHATAQQISKGNGEYEQLYLLNVSNQQARPPLYKSATENNSQLTDQSHH